MEVTPFLSSFFIIFREGFEAMLIAMLIFTYLEKMNATDKQVHVWQGISMGVLGSLIIAVLFSTVSSMTHTHEELFEAGTMIVASVVLAYVAFWCHNAKQHVEGHVTEAISKGTTIALFLAVFFAILREGFEIVLFYAGLFASPIADTYSIWAGGIAGAVALVFTYFGMKQLSLKIPTGMFFKISSVLLAILAMYFAYNGIHELVEVLGE